MFPPQGDTPLSLLFGVIPLVFAGLILLYIVIKLTRQWIQRRAVLKRGSMLDEFAHYPELEAMEGRMRLFHHQALTRLEVGEVADASHTKESVEHALQRGLDGARELRDAGENLERVKRAREEIAARTKELEAWATPQKN